MPRVDPRICRSIYSRAKNNQVSVNSMQSANLTRSAPPVSTTAASSTREDQAVIAAQPARAAKTTAGAAQQKDDSMAAFAHELAQVADDQQPVLQPDAKAPAEQPATEADAEQWLLHMLGQQSAQLQARDAEQGSTDETRAAINAAIQALPRALAGQEVSQAANNQALIAPSAEELAAGQLSAEQLANALASATATNEQLAGETASKIAAGENGRNAAGQALRDAELARTTQFKHADSIATAAVSGAGSTRLEKLKLDPALLDSESANQPLIAQLERLAAGASTTSSEVATRIDSTLINTPVTESAALERTLKLQGPETKWGEQLLQALRDNVELQMQQRVQNTTIRLDPPELGSMEITLSHEQGRLNVQISAQHSDVVRLLQQTSDRLRHELVAQNFTQVDVEISGGQPGQQHSQRDQARLFNEQSVLANQHEADQSDAHHLAPEQQKSAQHNDVLVTV